MPYSYRALTSADAEAWQSLRLEGARDFPLGFVITVEEAADTPIEQCRSILDHGNTRGVFYDGRLVGMCGFRREVQQRTRHRAEIGPFFVTKGHQGKGAAQVLMQGVIDEARSCGIEQLELYVDTHNTRAWTFYEKQGFERIAVHPDGVRINGESRDGFFYCLRLQPEER